MCTTHIHVTPKPHSTSHYLMFVTLLNHVTPTFYIYNPSCYMLFYIYIYLHTCHVPHPHIPCHTFMWDHASLTHVTPFAYHKGHPPYVIFPWKFFFSHTTYPKPWPPSQMFHTTLTWHASIYDTQIPTSLRVPFLCHHTPYVVSHFDITTCTHPTPLPSCATHMTPCEYHPTNNHLKPLQ